MGIDVNGGRPLELALPPRLARRLERSGPLGRVLLGLPSGVDPGTLHSRAESLDVRNLIGRGHLASSSDQAVVRRVARAVESTAGANSGVFGVILIGSAIAIGGMAWMRRRPYL